MRTTPRVLAALAHASVGAAALAVLASVVPGHPVAAALPPTAAPPSADDAYIQHLTDSGWTIVDRDQVIRVAHAECSNLWHGKATVDVIDQVVRQYRIAGHAAVTQLIAAEAAYCPHFLGR